MEIKAIYNIHGDEETCFVTEAQNGGYWYAFQGSKSANFTYDELRDGCDTLELNDEDTMTLSEGVFDCETDLIETLDEEVENELEEESDKTVNMLLELGFEHYKNHEITSEFNAIATPAIIEKLEAEGYSKTWGHEGDSVNYAVFKCDNNEHPDFGKEIISLCTDHKMNDHELLDYKQKAYVLNSLYCTDYSDEKGEIEINDTLTTKGKLQYVANSLKREAFHDYNEHKFKNNSSAIVGDHIQGLPSYLNIDFENFNILEVGKKWGIDLSSEEKEDQFLESWFEERGKDILSLMEDNGVDVRADNSIFEKAELSGHNRVEEALAQIDAQKEAEQTSGIAR